MHEFGYVGVWEERGGTEQKFQWNRRTDSGVLTLCMYMQKTHIVSHASLSLHIC